MDDRSDGDFNNEHSENSPLLAAGVDRNADSQHVARQNSKAIACIIVLGLLSNFCFYATELPFLALIEQRVCATYNDRQPRSKRLYDPVKERTMCKVPVVQNKVAFIVGCKTAFDAIPPLLTSMWYGSLANRLGRRPVIALASSGELLNVIGVIIFGFTSLSQHIELIWLASLLLLLGGGQFLLYAMYDVILIDVTKETEEGRRVQWLSILHSTTLINELFAPQLAAIIMQQDLLLAFIAVVCAAVIRYPVIWALPETVNRNLDVKSNSGGSDPSPVRNPGPTQTLLKDMAPQSREHQPLISLLRTLASRSGILFCLTCFLVKRIAFTSEILMFQYTSELFEQPLDKTAWIRIWLGSSATLITTLGIPIYFQAFANRRTGTDGLSWQMRAVRVSLLVLTAGFGTYWLASSANVMIIGLLLCGAGEGLAPSLQAVAAAVTEPVLHTSLFAAISMVDTIAKLFGGPIMAAAFSIRNESGKTHGFCFALSMLLFALLWCASWATLPRRAKV